MTPYPFRRYGLLGLNGCGKSTLLAAIGCRELPIPEHMDIYHLSREIEASDMSSLEAVINCDEERLQLEKEVEALVAQVSHIRKRDFPFPCLNCFFLLLQFCLLLLSSQRGKENLLG